MKKLFYFCLVAIPILLLTYSLAYAPPPSFPPLQVEEVDGSPTGVVYKLVVTNGSISEYAGGVATLTLGGSGQAVAFDIDDDGNESDDIGEIAIIGDTNSVFSESGDKVTVTMSNNWPTADEADTLSTALTHELGGLEADISAYTGLVAITGSATAEVDALAELNAHLADATLLDDGAIADSTAIGLNAGDTYSNYGAAGDDSLNELFAAIDTAITGGDAFTLKVDAGATAGYLGAANSDGILRTDGTIVTYTDGGNFVTLGLHDYLDDLAGVTAVQGNILYFDGTDWVVLAPDTEGKYLQTHGAGANPTWESTSISGDIENVGDVDSGAAFTADGGGNTLYFEGSTGNAFEIALTGADPGADVTVTIPAETGSVVLGPAGFGTDNLLVKTNGTGNITQATGISVDDSNNMSSIGTIGSGAITSTGVVTGTGFTIGSAAILEAELEILDGASLSGSTTDLNAISGLGAEGVDATELGYVNGLSEDIQTSLDARCLESVFGDGIEADDLELSGTTLQLVAEIPHLDAAAAISGVWEVQDNTLFNFGNDADWGIRYDTTGTELDIVGDMLEPT